MKITVYSTTNKIRGNGKIQKGLQWNQDGHRIEVKDVNGNKCIITEDWIAEDTGEPQHTEEKWSIGTSDNGNEYVYPDDYPNYNLYATGADNYNYKEHFALREQELDEAYAQFDPEDKDSFLEDEYEDDDWQDMYDYYTPSASRGDYSPSAPWNAPGMSIHDFI